MSKNPYICLKKWLNKPLKYVELCKIIKEPAKKGKSKQLHIKRIEKYTDIEKTGSKYIIHKVYENDGEMQIIESQGRFTTYLRRFMINMFCELKREYPDKHTIVLTNRDILEQACMVNQNYFVGKNSPYKFLDFFKVAINKGDIPNEEYMFDKVYSESEIFFSSSYRLLKRVVYDSLTSMEKSSLLIKNKTFRLYRNYTDEYGKFHSESKNCDRVDESKILSAQHRSIVEFNNDITTDENGKKKYFLTNIHSVHYLYPRQRKEFYKILNRNIQEAFKDEGWNAYSSAWKLTLADVESFNYELQHINYKQLNQNVQDKLMSSKDLQIIENVLREQFISMFISIKDNRGS